MLAATLLAPMVLFPILTASSDLVVNRCDDASQWRGGSPETVLVKEGAGAVRWIPSQNVELSTRAIPHDWSGGNCLRFWMHSAKATGSHLTVVLPSASPTREGPDYFSLNFQVDWQGWREILAPFAEIGRVRQPEGWQKIDSFRLHAAWNPVQKINREDAFVIDDIRVTKCSWRGMLMTDREFFAALDRDASGTGEDSLGRFGRRHDGGQGRFSRLFPPPAVGQVDGQLVGASAAAGPAPAAPPGRRYAQSPPAFQRQDVSAGREDRLGLESGEPGANRRRWNGMRFSIATFSFTIWPRPIGSRATPAMRRRSWP